MTIDLRKTNTATRDHVVRVPDAVRSRPVDPIDDRPLVRARNASTRARERSVFYIAASCVVLFLLVLLYIGLSRTSLFAPSDDTIIRRVGAIMVLPEGEQPTVATVSDMHALEGQAFFKSAAEGDKVLMYLKAQKAIIYRPSNGKIVEVGPITGGTQ